MWVVGLWIPAQELELDYASRLRVKPPGRLCRNRDELKGVVEQDVVFVVRPKKGFIGPSDLIKYNGGSSHVT